MDNNIPRLPLKGCDMCEESFPESVVQAKPNKPIEGEPPKENFLYKDRICFFHELVRSVIALEEKEYNMNYWQNCDADERMCLEDMLAACGDYSSKLLNERRSRQLLLDSGCRIVGQGYFGNGVKLLIGTSETTLRLCLVVTPSEHARANDELEDFRKFDCPPYCRREVHHWRHDQKQPDIELIGLSTGNRSSLAAQSNPQSCPKQSSISESIESEARNTQ